MSFIIHLKDGKTLKEGEVEWKDIPKEEVSSLQLYKHNHYYTISVDGKNVELIQLKRAITGNGPFPTGICERVIGFTIENKYAIKMTVDEKTGNVLLTVEQKDEKNNWRKL